jgi:hypothetical protein
VLIDAYERKEYAVLISKGNRNDETKHISPVRCDFTAADGSEKKCNTIDEFRNALKRYVEE